jgi:hypothetical protein
MKKTLILLIAFLFSPANTIADDLEEGVWSGTITNYLNKRYELRFNVEYEFTDENDVLQIQMVNLDLEPRPDYTYQLTEINVKEKQLSFKIPGVNNHYRKCILTKQEEYKYSGECVSDNAANGEISLISMEKAKPEE